MEVEASIEPPLVFAGSRIVATVEFRAPPTDSQKNAPVLLSGYAAVQGSFRIGEMILSEPFAETKKAGTVLTKRGLDYGQPQVNSGLFSGVLDGLRHLMAPNSPGTPGPPGQVGTPHSTTLGAGTRSDDGEYPIFSTAQTLLFTDLKLERGESPQKFRFSIDLPANLPPTYRSRSLHIVYNLVVGFERVRLDGGSLSGMNSRLQDTRLFLPFRLLPKPPTALHPDPPKFDLREPINAPAPCLEIEESQEADLDFPDASEEKSADSNETRGVESDMDSFVSDLIRGQVNSTRSTRNRSSSIAHIPGAHYSKVSYDINRGSAPIAQLVLARPAISVGDVLAAHIIFRRPCLHVSVYLELEEVIDEQYAALGGRRVARPAVKKSQKREEHEEGDVEADLENDENEPLNQETPSGTPSETPSETPRETSRETPRETPAGTPRATSRNTSSDIPRGSPVMSPKARRTQTDSEDVVATTYTIYAREFQGVYGLSDFPIFLPTLNSITPRLDTDQLTAGWTLRIEFVGLAGAAFTDDDENELLAKGQIDHEIFICRIPIAVLPPMSGGLNAAKTWRF